MATTFQNYSYPSSSDVTITGIGNPVSQPTPPDAVYIAGRDPSGNLHGVATDANGDLIVSPLTSSSTVTVVQPTGTNLHAVIDASALPTGAATSSLQSTGNISLSSIDSKTPALGQALAAGSVPVVLPAAQVTALTPPTTVTVTQATGTNLHAVIDSGTVTLSGTSTVSGTVTVQQPTGTNLHTVVDASALPTGAATATNQTSEITQLTTVNSNLAAIYTRLANQPNSYATIAQYYLPYSTTNVTTGAYVQITNTLPNIATGIVEVFDSSGQSLMFATGNPGSEVVQFYITPGGNGPVKILLPSSSRLAIKAITGTANSGYLIINIYG